MGNIYIIKNTINDKVYIGQTLFDVETRWKQHLQEAKKHTNRHLYNAINYYGEDKFYYEILVKDVEDKDLNDLEKHYIKLYDSFNSGYNMTIGGEGGSIYDINVKQVYELWKDGLSPKQIAEELKCSIEAIYSRLKTYPDYDPLRTVSRPVHCYDLFGMYLQSFCSAAQAERVFGGKRDSDNIAATARGIQKTAYGLQWSYEKLKSYKDIHEELSSGMEVPIAQYTKDGKFIQYHKNIRAAEKYMKEKYSLSHVHIGDVCKRKTGYKSAGGYVWRYYFEPFKELKKSEVARLADLLDD